MKLFSKEEAMKANQLQNKELVDKNAKLLSSLQKRIKLSNEIPIDFERQKKEKEYKIFVKDIQEKKSDALKELKGYQDAIDDAKEKLFAVISKQDKVENNIIDLEKEVSRLTLQAKWLKINVEKHDVILPRQA